MEALKKGQLRDTRNTEHKGQSRDTHNTEHKTQKDDKQTKNRAQLLKRLARRTLLKNGVNPGVGER